MIYDNRENFLAVTNIHTSVVIGIFWIIHQSHK